METSLFGSTDNKTSRADFIPVWEGGIHNSPLMAELQNTRPRKVSKNPFSRFLLSILAVAGWISGQKEASAVDYNVLFLVSDDITYSEMGCLSDTVCQTPNIDALADRGIRFSNAYNQYSVCGPTRCSFFSGLNPETTQVLNNTDSLRDFLPNCVTFPELFRQNGWYTVQTGKMYNAQDNTYGPEWDEILSPASVPSVESLPGETRNLTGGDLAWCYWKAAESPNSDFADYQMASAAISWMQNNLDKQPWFLGVGFYLPHDPFVAPKPYFDMYPLSSMIPPEEPGDASPRHPEALPNETDFAHFDLNDKQEYMRSLYACSTFMDEQMGRVVDALDALGLDDNTIIVFFGDHGYHVGEHEWWNKVTVYDEASRAPIIVVTPDMVSQRGVDCRRIIEHLDLYPTFVELCGLTGAPSNLEGESFVPLLENPDLPLSTWELTKSEAYSVINRGSLLGKSVRSDRYRFTQWDSENKDFELYDELNDPGEFYNLALDLAANGDIVMEMKDHMYMRSTGNVFDIPENPLNKAWQHDSTSAFNLSSINPGGTVTEFTSGQYTAIGNSDENNAETTSANRRAHRFQIKVSTIGSSGLWAWWEGSDQANSCQLYAWRVDQSQWVLQGTGTSTNATDNYISMAKTTDFDRWVTVDGYVWLLALGTVDPSSNNTFGSDYVKVVSGGSAPPDHIICTAAPVQIVADGTATAEITATLVDEGGNPVVATNTIDFSMSGEGSLNGSVSKAAVAGIATIALQSNTNLGTASVTATSTDLAEGSVNVDLTVGPAAKLISTASDSSIDADGTSTSLVTAQAYDADDHLVTTAFGGSSGWSGLSNGSGAWLYRKPITINSSSALSNYQVEIAFTDIDVAGLVSGGKMQNDYDDARFTLSDGSTEVDSYIDLDSSSFWLEVPSIANGNTTIYMYYGNPAATAVSDGSAVFDFFDDFASLDTGVWAEVNINGAYSIVNNTELRVRTLALGLNEERMFADWTPTSNSIIETKMKAGAIYRGGIALLNSSDDSINVSTKGSELAIHDISSTDCFWFDGTSSGSPLLDTWYKARYIVNGNASSGAFYNMGGTQLYYRACALGTTGLASIAKIRIGAWNDTTGDPVASDYYYDWIRVRQYAASEPTANGGLEEENMAPANITFSLSGPGTLLGSTSPLAVAGAATVILQSGGSSGTATITATTNSLTQDTVQVEILSVGPHINCSATPASIRADGNAISLITAGVHDSGDALIDTATNTIVFSMSGQGSLINPTSKAAVGGLATINMQSNTTVGTAVVTGTSTGLFQGMVQVNTTPNPVKIICTADITTIGVGGSSAFITAEICDSGDNLVNTTVNNITFGIVGDGSLVGGSIKAASGGIATIEFQSGTLAGTMTVTATSQEGSGLTEGSVNIETTPGTGTKLVNAANPGSIDADGTSTSLITAQASDQYDNPVTTMNGISGWSGLSNGSGAWLYRKPLTITSSSALSDYQVKIAFTAAGVAGLISGGKMQANCEDVRFTLSDETTEVSYWLDSTFSDAKYFWLNIPSVANGSTVLYMYYGNPAANAVSDGDATFELFDDFEGTTLDTGKWQAWQVGPGTQNMSVSGGSLNLSAQGSKWSCSGIYTQATTNYSSLIIEVKNKWDMSATNDTNKEVRITDAIPALQDSGDQYRFDYYHTATEDGYRFVKNVADIGSVQSSAVIINQNPTNYEWERYVMYSGNQLAYRSTDGINYNSLWTSAYSAILNLPANLYLGYSVSEGSNLATSSAQLDWFRVRQYVSTEPGAAVGSEEENVVNATITFSVTGPGTLLGETAPEAVDGVATVIMQSAGANGTVTVTSTADSLTQGSINVVAGGATTAVRIVTTAAAASILADGSDTTMIYAGIYDAGTNLQTNAMNNITFSVSGAGTLVNPTMKAAVGGEATIVLQSTTSTGTATVTATSQEDTGLDQGTVQVTTTERQVKILCTTDNASILADGVANAIISARVCDSGNALVDTAANTLTFSVSGAGTLVNPTTKAASSGIATVELVSTTNTGTPTVAATASGLSQGEVDIITLPRQVKIIATADRTSIASNGTSTALVTASICDTGDALVNTAVETVTFSISGDGNLISATQQGAIAGKATVIMQSIDSQPGTASVTATASGLTRDSIGITTEPKVVDPPTGLTITAKTEHTLTLGWTAGEDNQYYLVERSENGVDYVMFSENYQGLTIIDEELRAGATYYYKVYGYDSEDDSSIGVGINGMTTEVEEILIAGGGKVGTVGEIELDVPGDTFTEDAYIDINSAVETGAVDISLVKLADTARDIKAKTLFGTDITTFGKDVELKLYYTDEDLVGVLEETLKIYWLDESNNKWVKVGGTVDTDNKCVTTMLSHFSVYCVMGESSETELEIQNVASYPNPMTDSTVFTFEINRAASVKLEVFTTSGKLVKRYDAVDKDAGYNEIPAGGNWDGSDDNSDLLASGLYLYKLTATPDEVGGKTVTATGKLVIIK